MPETLKRIDSYAFNSCKSLTDFIVPFNVETIGAASFRGCSNLSYIIIPMGVTQIGDAAFANCTNLKSVHLPNSLFDIGEGAFYGCSMLADFIIPERISIIKKQTFEGCVHLVNISIPASVERIYQNAFAGCNGLENIIVHRNIPPLLYEDAFSNYDITLFVPQNSVDKYRTTIPWNKFRQIITFEGEEMQQYKCAIPIITYSDGCLHYICETEGAECITNITDVDIQTHKGNVVRLTATYTINVYATATGYENSDIATATLCWIDADPKIEGIENRVAQVRANAVLIQSHNGVLSIAGVADGTDIAVYSTSGQMVGSAKARGTTSTIATSLRSGNVAIIRIGDKSIKVVMQ